MIRHISIFFLKEGKDGKKDENINRMVELLNEVEKKMPRLNDYMVGKNVAQFLPEEVVNGPEFGDVVQIIDFPNDEQAKAYVFQPVHEELQQKSNDIVEKVVVFDLKCV